MYSSKYKQLALTVAIASLLNQPTLMAETRNQAYFDSSTQRLYIPTLDADDLGHYALDFNVAGVDPLTFELDLTSINAVTASSYANAYYNSNTGVLNIPTVLVDTNSYHVTLQQTAEANGFNISQIDDITAPSSAKNVDTGQRYCYGNHTPISCPEAGSDFFGQDAQYSGVPAQYTKHDNGTVTDNVTGLIWLQSVDTNADGVINASDKFSLSAAEEYVAQLNSQNYAGYSDWRLPSIKEQYSLMDFRGTDPSGESSDDTSTLTPFIDNRIFDFAYGDTEAGERIIDSQYASNTLYVSTASGEQLLFGVNFADGRIKGYGMQLRGTDKTFFVQPVRGDVYGENQFIDNGDGTISDNASGLMWVQDDSGEGMNWQQAFAWAAQKNAENYLGYNDWRLPNVKELQFIVDYSRSPDTSNSAAIDPLFNTTLITNEAGQDDYAFYWSSTTHATSNGMGANGAYVAFGRSLGYMDNEWTDVHGAGSQRSDPKAGDPADYPTGNGPQGDAIRVYNYVRLVRGGISHTVYTGGEVPVVSNDTSVSEEPTTDAPPADNAQEALQTPPQEAITACASLSVGDSCTVQTPENELAGVCQSVADNSLACVPESF